MNEKTVVQQAVDAAKNSWLTNNGFSWATAGEVTAAVIVLGLFLVVLKSSKNFKGKLEDEEK
jgi:hypothetical protein